MRKLIEKSVSLLMCGCLFASVAAFPASANYGDEVRRPNVADIVPSDADTNTFYFYMPQDWRNEYNDAYDGKSLDSCKAGIYWWEGSYNCEKSGTNTGWPGYVITDTDPADSNIFVADVPKDVVTIMFNNTVDGGGDLDAAVYNKSVYTCNIPAKNYEKGEDGYGFYPNGTDSFDGMIYVIDPKWVEVNEYGDRRITRGAWFYYYGGGEYGINKEPVEGEVYKSGEFPTYDTQVDEKPAGTAPTTAKTTVTVKNAPKTLYVKGTAKIKATVKNGKGKTTYKSSNKKVAKVSKNGKITALKKGTATITVTNNGVSKKFKIKVKKPKLNKSKMLIMKGLTFKLKITGKVGTPKFSSSNKKVATVSKKGKIKAKKKGKATITVKTNGLKLKCKITVFSVSGKSKDGSVYKVWGYGNEDGGMSYRDSNGNFWSDQGGKYTGDGDGWYNP